MERDPEGGIAGLRRKIRELRTLGPASGHNNP